MSGIQDHVDLMLQNCSYHSESLIDRTSCSAENQVVIQQNLQQSCKPVAVAHNLPEAPARDEHHELQSAMKIALVKSRRELFVVYRRCNPPWLARHPLA